MNNNTFSSTTTINDDYMLFPYNDHYSSLPLSPSSSSINDLLIHSNTPNNHHPFLQAPSPFSPFDFVQDFSLPSFHTQNNGHDNNQTTPNDHPPPPPSPLPPLSNPIEESQLVEPWETITQIEDSQRISSSAPQDPKTKKVKKPTRADRHSKIKTAKGTRDRRMRLSLDVARELFGLQDMLGFEKASKTVEWLLIQAKPEIMKIAKTLPHQCGLSSGEESHTRPALGSTDTSPDLSELASMWTVDDSGSNINMTEMKVDGRSMRGKRKRPEPRTPILKKMSKDERAKARERARKRTNEKMMKRRSQVNVVEEEEAHKSNNSDVNSTPYKEENEQLCKKDRLRVGEDFLMNNKYPLLNGHRNQGATTSMEQHHHQFTDLHHFFGKPRDLMYNYYNMR